MTQYRKEQPAQTTGKQRLEPRAVKPITVTVPKAAEITGLGLSTIWAMLADGRLESTSVGRRRLVYFASLEQLLANPRQVA